MAENTKILTAEQESQLRAPIDEYVTQEDGQEWIDTHPDGIP